MTDLPQLIADRLAAAFADVAGGPADPAVRRSDRADYQADGALPLAKKLRRNPREVATEVLEKADLGDLVANVEIAGPGFLNLTLNDTTLSALVQDVANDDRLGVANVKEPQRIVVDYSSPNVAKEMHVGHLRSTIIGDALVRILEHLGHEVIRRNHIGDWGTQFGLVIEHLIDEGATPTDLNVSDLGGLYTAANAKFKADEDFKDRARQRVVKLQAGDEETLALWRVLVAESERYFADVYETLGVTLTPEDNVGESAYNDQLASVVEELTDLGLAVESDGALCVFPDGFKGRDGNPFPLILRKSDGGYNYDTTDLAAIRMRIRDLKAQRLVYTTDLGQQLHFHMVFQAAKQAGWLDGETTTAEFDGFGVVLGPDRKRLRTREGNNPKLVDLLEEAIRRAAAVVEEKSPHLEAEEQQAVAKAVGIGALKYADLSNDRVKDYVFDWDRMLAMEGNTGVYMQYAHARTKSILRRGEVDPASLRGVDVRLVEPEERALALRLLEFEGALLRAADGVEIHRVCLFLFELASAFTSFYDKCPVLKAPDEQTKLSRLVLCEVTGRTLAAGLGVLGISAPDRM